MLLRGLAIEKYRIKNRNTLFNKNGELKGSVYRHLLYALLFFIAFNFISCVLENWSYYIRIVLLYSYDVLTRIVHRYRYEY